MRGVPPVGFMGMDRRQFIKWCSVLALGSVLGGCRKLPFSGDAAKKGPPSLKMFEAEVRRAMSMNLRRMDLVPVQMPGRLKRPGASDENRFGMAIDLEACDGCGKCILACIHENNIPLVTEDDAAKGRFMHWIEMRGGVPFMCAHCGNAPCERACPTGAANHTPDGLSAMMYKRCTGSRYCGANCPEHARKFNFNDAVRQGLSLKFNDKVPVRDKGVMEKCSLCLHRLQDDRLEVKAAGGVWRGRGVKTACAEACPKGAIIFGNWLDPDSPLVKAARRRDLYAPEDLAGLDPSVVYMMGGK